MRFDDLLWTVRSCLAAGMKVFVSIAEAVYADYAKSRKKDLDDLNVEYIFGHQAIQNIPKRLVEQHRKHFPRPIAATRVVPDQNPYQDQAYWNRVESMNPKQPIWEIALPVPGSKTDLDGIDGLRVLIDTNMTPIISPLRAAVDEVKGKTEIVTVDQVEVELGRKRGWDSVRRAVDQARAGMGDRWRRIGARPKPNQKWRKFSFKKANKNEDASGDPLIVNQWGCVINNRPAGNVLDLVLTTDRGMEGYFRRMDTRQADVMFVKLSPASSDGRIALNDVDERDQLVLRPQILQKIIHYAVKDYKRIVSTRSDSPGVGDKRNREEEEEDEEGVGV